MKFSRFPGLAVLAMVLLFGCRTLQGQSEDRPVVKLTGVNPEQEEMAAKALAGVTPGDSKKPQALTRNGVYMLIGDLLGDGHVYAVLDRAPILVAEWDGGGWKTKAALDTPATWKYPGWNEEEAGTREPTATKPFWMLQLQGNALLVIASDVEKAGQNYDILAISPGFSRIVADTDSFAMAPKIEAGYLVTGDASRVKSEWEAWYYSRLEKGKFEVMKSWSESEPYNHPDDVSYEASSGSKSYTIVPILSDDWKAPDYTVLIQLKAVSVHGTGNEPKPQPYAKVWFKPKIARSKLSSTISEDEQAYLFEKLTGLPRAIYYEDHDGKAGRVEAMENIKVTGAAEAVKLLSY